jgi:hypothetical protein
VINTAVVKIRQGRFDEAATKLTEILQDLEALRGSLKVEAVCRYNLGVAYLRTAQKSSAAPNSMYARGAEAVLHRERPQESA